MHYAKPKLKQSPRQPRKWLNSPTSFSLALRASFLQIFNKCQHLIIREIEIRHIGRIKLTPSKACVHLFLWHERGRPWTLARERVRAAVAEPCKRNNKVHIKHVYNLGEESYNTCGTNQIFEIISDLRRSTALGFSSCWLTTTSWHLLPFGWITAWEIATGREVTDLVSMFEKSNFWEVKASYLRRSPRRNEKWVCE